MAVIEAVASVSGRRIRSRRDTDGAEHDALPPLYETIDPDALNALFDSPDAASHSAVTVTFRYCGYDVIVEGPGQVTVTERERPERET